MLTQWLAARSGLNYVRIDPLKVDVGRVWMPCGAKRSQMACAPCACPPPSR